SVRDMRLAASCLFDGNPCLATDSVFLKQYLEALRSIRSRIAIKRLIHSYCTHFDPNHEGIQRIGSFLHENIATIGGRWEWPQRNRQFKLFDPVQGPKLLAQVTATSENPRGELERLGLRGQLSVSGLAVFVFLAALKNIEQQLSADGSMLAVERAI